MLHFIRVLRKTENVHGVNNECIQIMVNEGIQQIIVNIIVVFRLI